MASIHSQIYVQFVLAVKGRQNLIHPKWEDQLYQYMRGMVEKMGQTCLAINGMPDHVHIFVSMTTSMSITNFVRELKKSTNVFINTQNFSKKSFEWQAGYGAFSHSHSKRDAVCDYISKQKQLHKNRTFRTEYIRFLQLNEIEFSDTLLFQWLDGNETSINHHKPVLHAARFN